jgi:membrane protein
MAKMKDMPGVVRSMGFVPFVKKLATEVSDDDVLTWAAALAYTWVFAMFPLLLAIVTLAPYMPGQTKQKAIAEVNDSIQQIGITGDAGTTVRNTITEVMNKPQGGLLSLGLLLAIWGASGGMAMTMTALDRAYEVKKPRSFVKQRLVAIGLTLATIVLVLAVLVLLPIGGAVIEYFQNQGQIGTALVYLLGLVRYVIAAALLLGVLALIYYFGPNIKQKWHAVSPGALIAVVTWVVVGVAFGIYVDKFGNFNATYGALGAAIALLLFFYISAAILLVGAEINSILDFATLGVEPGTQDFTEAVTDAKQEGRVTDEGRPTDAPPQQAAKAAAAGHEPMPEIAGQAAAGGAGRGGAKGAGGKSASPVRSGGPSGGGRDKPTTAIPVPTGPAQEGWWKWGLAAVVASTLVGGKKSAPR